ncbi:MAG: DUF2974 domain-containing protein [Bacilli bacterium]|nr:DUF2974 domain-containing protein [Bacilli bacterium]
MSKSQNIIDYIKKYGEYSFELVPFNELDSLIMSSLSYVSFSSILNNVRDKITIKEAGTKFFSMHTKKELKDNVFSVKTGIKVFASIYKTKRFQNLIITKYKRVSNEDKQFQAICININSRLSYLSFEGTDDLVSGWIEDAKMSYSFKVPAQKEAIKYINHHFNPFSNRKYILGGHSKGGNLALVAAMYARNILKSKIKEIYVLDAPGLREKEINSPEFKSIEDRVKRIIINYSIVGVLFKNTEKVKIVESLKKGPMAHNLINWRIDDKEFSYTKLSAFSRNFKEKVDNWLNSYNDYEKQEFVNNLKELFKRSEIVSLIDIKNNKIRKLHKLIKESKKLDSKSKDIVNTLIKFLLEFIKEESSSLISSKIPNLKH